MAGPVSPDLIQPLLGLGLPGIVILGLAWQCLRLERRNEAQAATISELNEKRIQEAVRGVTALEQNTASLEQLSAVLRERKA